MRFRNHILSARTSQLRCCSGFHICRTDFYFHNFSRYASILCCAAQPDKQFLRHLRNNAPTYPENFPGTALLHVRGHRLQDGDKSKKFVVKAGFMEGKVMDAAETNAIAKLPNREGMLSMFAGALTSTLSGLAVAMQAYADKQEEPAA